MPLSHLALTVLLAVSAPPTRTAAAEAGPTMSNCLVTLIDESQVPAQEAGVLVKIGVREGDQVKRDQVLAQVDDMQVRLQRKAADMEQRAAAAKAASDVDVRFATAAAGVAKLEYERAIQANRRTPGAIAEVEVNRLNLAWKKAELQIEQSQIEREVQRFTAQNKAAEVEGSDNNILRRQITAPLDGMVIQINGHVGEWVKPGDTVLRIVRIDHLRVEGFLSSEAHSPDEISGCEVSVEVALAHGRKLRFPGRVVFVSPVVEAGGAYRVWAEVENRQSDNQQWLLRAGLTADMTIRLK